MARRIWPSSRARGRTRRVRTARSLRVGCSPRPGTARPLPEGAVGILRDGRGLFPATLRTQSPWMESLPFPRLPVPVAAIPERFRE